VFIGVHDFGYFGGRVSDMFGSSYPNISQHIPKIVATLVICYIAIENGHRNSGFTYSKW